MNDKEGRKWLLQKLYDNGFKYIFHSGGIGGYIATKQQLKFENDRTYIEGNFERIDVLSGLILDFNEPNYLDIGKYFGIVDWSKVAVDTPIKIRYNDGVVVNRHFSKFLGGMVYYFDNGRTSWSETGETKIMPKYVRLAGGDDEK